jgi:transposase
VHEFDSCGIEISAATLLVRLRREGQILPTRPFPNTSAGHRDLIRFLSGSRRPVRICQEATGHYGLDLAVALSQVEGFELMVVNPKVMRRFAEALLQRSKTDRLDVVAIEEFALRMPFERWSAPPANRLHLRAIARRLQDLTDQRTAEKNRRHALKVTQSSPEILLHEIERSLEHLTQSHQNLLRAAIDLIQQDAELLDFHRLLLTIKGIGPLSSVLLLGELAILSPDFTARQWVAFAGLDPKICQSGSSVDRPARLSKAGNLHLRKALYMPALTAVKHEHGFRDFYQALVKRAKKPLQAICAAMRKLLHAIHGMLRSRTPFDPSKLFPHPPTQRLVHQNHSKAIYCQ